VSTGPPTHTLFLVPSANHAVQGEAALLRERIRCRLIPVPRSLSSQCGVCLSVRLADRSAAATVLCAAGTVTEGVHDVCLPSADGVREATPSGEATAGGPATARGKATTRNGGTAGTGVTGERTPGSQPPAAESTQRADRTHQRTGDEGGNHERDRRRLDGRD